MQIINPYGTSILSHYRLSAVQNAIEASRIDHKLKYLEGNGLLANDVWLVVDNGTDIPAWGHPIVEGENIYIDARTFTRYNRHEDVFTITNSREYGFQTIRCALIRAFQDDERSISLRSSTLVPLEVFCAWVSEGMQRRLGLDPTAQMQISVLAGMFYLGQFDDYADITETELVKLANQVARATRVPLETILNLLGDDYRPPVNVRMFCEQLNEMVESSRVSKLNSGLLFTMLGGGWFTNNGKEVASCALEHPPTWIAMVYFAAQDRSLRDTPVAKIVKRLDRRGYIDDFRKAIHGLITHK